jgi:hypothetical protein
MRYPIEQEQQSTKNRIEYLEKKTKKETMYLIIYGLEMNTPDPRKA